MSIGNTVTTTWEAPDMQGGVPVTVRDMLALTEEQRLALVGGKEALEENEAEATLLRERLKAAKAVIETPQPAAPPPYMGAPLHELDEEIMALSLRVSEHKKAKDSLSARMQQASHLNTLRADLSRDIAMYTESQASLERERDEALPIFQRYNAAMKAVPPILEGYKDFGQLLNDVADALVWLRSTSGEDVGVAIQTIRQLGISCEVPQVRFERSDELYDITGPNPDRWLCHIEDEIKRGHNAVESMKAELKRTEEQLAGLKVEPLNEEQYIKDVTRLDECSKLRLSAHEWDVFERRTGEWAVQRSKMSAEADKVSQRLDELRMEKAAIVSRLKSSVEARANDMLSRAGMPPLEIDVVTTAKRASLRVSVAGVAMEALAASELLVYGLCTLSSIHQASDAKCPLLVAECAEMDEQMFKRVVAALGTPEKGNIVLEHWLPIEGSIVMGGKE
jgi:vacuolar-type H+-ATPase subunit I/STV1